MEVDVNQSRERCCSLCPNCHANFGETGRLIANLYWLIDPK